MTSLVLANPSKATPVPDTAFEQAMSGGSDKAMLADYRITLILTNNTLVQQWHGERPRHLSLNRPRLLPPSTFHPIFFFFTRRRDCQVRPDAQGDHVLWPKADEEG